MFQYAVARSITHRLGAELVLDSWSGFVREVDYHRKYELYAFNIQGRLAKSWERLPIWFYRLLYRGGRLPSSLMGRIGLESFW